MIILPAIDLRGGQCVRLFQGDYAKETVYSKDPAGQAEQWAKSGAEILHLVDLDGAKAGHIINEDAIRGICSRINIPCELGGGIRTIADAEKAFSLGIARVILGTTACENPELVDEFLKKFGADKVVAGIDAKNGMVALRGWIDTSTVTAHDLAKSLVAKGIRRIIFTDIATDGALKGPNTASIDALCKLVADCKIVASGGVSSAADIRSLAALKHNNLEGAIVGKALYDGRTTMAELLQAAKESVK